MVYVVRRDMIKIYPFPEVDFVVPESSVWCRLGNHKTRLCAEIIQYKEYKAPHAISFSGKMEYSKGRAYAQAITQRHFLRYRQPLRVRLRRLINFLRFCRHGDIALSDAVRLWHGNSPLPLIILLWPIASALARRDSIAGKVLRTHVEFLAAQRAVRIHAFRLVSGKPHALS